MARIRTIKPELATSLTVASWSLLAQALWPRLFCHMDDAGRSVYDPRLIGAAVAPLMDEVRPADIDAVVTEWASTGSVQLYTDGGRTYLQVSEWESHQRINRPTASVLPAPGNSPEFVPVATPAEPSSTTHALLTEDSRGERKGREQGREQGNTLVPISGSGPADAEPVENDPVSRDGFTAWWDRYRALCRGRPTGYGAKAKAKRSWDRLSRDDRQSAIDALPLYGRWLAMNDAGRSQPFPSQHGATWLNQRTFDDVADQLEDAQAPLNGGGPDTSRDELCPTCSQVMATHRPEYCYTEEMTA